MANQGKYEPLQKWLIAQGKNNSLVQLSFQQIEEIIGEALPDSAYTYQAWWANDKTHSQAIAWLEAGWEVDSFNLSTKQVTFRRV